MMSDERIERIESAYAAARDGGRAAWSRSAEAGPAAPIPYDERALAYTIGSTFEPPPAMAGLIAELDAVAADDARVCPVPRAALHFTFLAVTPHRWDALSDMPAADAVRDAATRRLERVPFEIDGLRLLPGKNALLLAGLPSCAMLDARDRLIADLVAVGVGPWLTERYGPAFPPTFWHTTLARCRSEFATPALRSLYDRHEGSSFGPLRLGPPRLHAANFDWTRRHAIR